MINLPIYNEDKPPEHGLYIGLFHGRKDPDEQLDDWGCNGPIIGPLKYIHTTYLSHIKLEFIREADSRLYGFNTNEMKELTINDEMVLFQDVWYGDWTTYYYEESIPTIDQTSL